MKKLFAVFVAGIWFAFVFLVTFFFTFPSNAVKERIRSEVVLQSNGAYSLDLSGIGPWWVGGHADGLKLYSTEAGQAPQLIFLAQDLWTRASLFSTLTGSPSVNGTIRTIDSDLDYSATLSPDKRGNQQVTALYLEGSDYAVADLLALAGAGTGTGGVDILVDINAAEGMSKADGIIRFSGNGMLLSDIDLPTIGPLGKDVLVEELDLKFDVRNGKATVKVGKFNSDLISLTVSGDVQLADRLANSRVDLIIEFGELGELLQSFKNMIPEKLQCSGRLSNLASACGPPRAKRSSRSTPRKGSSRTAKKRERPTSGSARPSKEERIARMKERAKKRRAEREAKRAEREEEEELDDEPLDEEEADEDEEIIEDEEDLDEEEFDEEE